MTADGGAPAKSDGANARLDRLRELPDPEEPRRGKAAKGKRHRLSTLHFDAAHDRYIATPEFHLQPF